MININLYNKALQVANMAHADQVRKSTSVPYITHPIAVANLTSTITNDTNTLCVAFLHDVLEDASESVYNEQMMLHDFNSNIVKSVKILTKDKSIKDWHERSIKYLGSIAMTDDFSALTVCAADKLHNITFTIEDYNKYGEIIWGKFNSTKHDQLWWYSSVYGVLKGKDPHSKLVERLGANVLDLSKLIS